MRTSWHLEAEAQIGRGITARRHRMANGLGLLTAIDRRAPIVAVRGLSKDMVEHDGAQRGRHVPPRRTSG